MAADNPIRWWLFLKNKDNYQTNEDIDHCPCGTGGGCDICAGMSEWLYGRWLAVLHPFRYFWTVKIRRKVWYA